MVFRCSLERPRHTSAPDRAVEPPEDLGDYDVLVMHACDLLSRTDARFHIGGFGSDDWHLDIRYDLSVFMEQLPDLAQAIAERSEHELNLYSQGVERSLIFHPGADSVQIRCISGTSWVPEPDVEVISFPDLTSMLTRLAVDFVESLKIVDARLAGVNPFDRWAGGRFC